jgi:hypothetical protein
MISGALASRSVESHQVSTHTAAGLNGPVAGFYRIMG